MADSEPKPVENGEVNGHDKPADDEVDDAPSKPVN